MKKIMILAAVILSFMGGVEISAQSKQDIKEAKTQAKQLTKEGWTVEGIGTIQGELEKIQAKRANAEVLIGSAYGKKKATLAKAEARNNAINEYAEYQKSLVQGRVTSGMTDLGGEEAENFANGFERLVVHELNGEISIPALVLMKTVDGLTDVRCYYIIDNNAAEKARERAIKQAIDEAGLAQEYGNKISEFISDGYNAQ